MRTEDYFAYWGRDRLRRWPAHVVADLAIPGASRDFLIEVGLPSLKEGTLRFDLPQTEALPRLPWRPTCRILGYDTSVPLCLDEGAGGQVVSAEDEKAGSFLFVNDSVGALGECLTHFDRYLEQAASAGEAEILEEIARVEERMSQRDPRAFADPDCFWPLVIAQMREGSL